MPGIIDLPKFNYEDLEEIAAGGQGSFGVNENACFLSQMSHESMSQQVGSAVFHKDRTC